MIEPQRAPRAAGANVLVGVVRLAAGRADGFRLFAATREAFLASLAPLLAFPLVGGGLMLAGGGGAHALAEMLATICAVLVPPVVSHALAGYWGRQAAWLRFATAFNWCQWVLPLAAVLLLAALGLATGLGLPIEAAAGLVVLGLAAYALWLHWFLVRGGLMVSRLQAILLVVVVNLITAVLVLGPRLLFAGVALDRA